MSAGLGELPSMTDDTSPLNPIAIMPMLSTLSFWVHLIGVIKLIFGISLNADTTQSIAQFLVSGVAVASLAYGYYLHRTHIVKVATTANATINSANATIATLKGN
jgi:hypothetical protein